MVAAATTVARMVREQTADGREIVASVLAIALEARRAAARQRSRVEGLGILDDRALGRVVQPVDIAAR